MKSKHFLRALNPVDRIEEDPSFQSGEDGILQIYAPKDRKAYFIEYENKVLVWIRSAMGHPAIYPLPESNFEAPVKAVLMDLDGTSVKSESFWIWIIEQTVCKLLGDPKFTLENADEPFVSGHSVSEHLQYCIQKYCPDKSVDDARKHYFDITHYEMNEILEGRGKRDAFQPVDGLKEFLLELKAKQVRIGLVTSGLYEKAWPEIISAFEQIGLGDPLEFYDAIITAGQAIRKGQTGTLGELSPKPHPWLYAETARVGLGIGIDERSRVLGIEDSSAGVLSIRLAGFECIGMSGGNIQQSGMESLLLQSADQLTDILPTLF